MLSGIRVASGYADASAIYTGGKSGSIATA